MRILTAAEMRAADRAAIEDWGIPGLVLMENAALGVVEAVCRSYADAGRILIFCGPGNNGGDGLAVGRHLALRGFEPHLLLVGWSRNRSADADLQLDVCTRQGLATTRIETVEELRAVFPARLESDLWIDALFGTGLSRPLEDVFAEAVSWLEKAPVPVVAVDLPSGLDASSGELIGPCATADLTVTFAAPKVAHVFAPAAERCGEIVVTDLGIPERILEETPGALHLLTARELSAALRDVRPEDHKGSFGHCLVVAGSTGQSGAAVLAARGAVVGGAGLVTAAVPESLVPTVDAASLESMTLPLACDVSGALTLDAADQVLEAAVGKNCVALGPGLGTSGPTCDAAERILEACELPMVVDADELNAVRDRAGSFGRRSAPTVLTPHPGEAARLFGTTTAEVQADRVGFARAVATEHGVVLVLKGHQTLVAGPDGSVHVNPTGNPGMATGGSGDVLTGLIAALVARNYDPLVAACLGVCAHGQSGGLGRERQGLEGLRATDLLRRIPEALRSLRHA